MVEAFAKSHAIGVILALVSSVNSEKSFYRTRTRIDCCSCRAVYCCQVVAETRLTDNERARVSTEQFVRNKSFCLTHSPVLQRPSHVSSNSDKLT